MSQKEIEKWKSFPLLDEDLRKELFSLSNDELTEAF